MHRLVVALTLLVTSACSTIAVQVPVTRPAERHAVDFVVAHFHTDAALTGTEVGIEHARQGRWPDAVGVFRSVASGSRGASASVRAKAWHNLGLAHLYAHDFVAARVAISRANELDPSGDLARELAELDRLAAAYERMRLVRRSEPMGA